MTAIKRIAALAATALAFAMVSAPGASALGIYPSGTPGTSVMPPVKGYAEHCSACPYVGFPGRTVYRSPSASTARQQIYLLYQVFAQNSAGSWYVYNSQGYSRFPYPGQTAQFPSWWDPVPYNNAYHARVWVLWFRASDSTFLGVKRYEYDRTSDYQCLSSSPYCWTVYGYQNVATMFLGYQ